MARDKEILRFVWQEKIMNSVGKARSRARAHIAGGGRFHDAVVNISLAAEERRSVRSMSREARLVAEGIYAKLEQRGFKWRPITERTPDGAAYRNIQLQSIWTNK